MFCSNYSKRFLIGFCCFIAGTTSTPRLLSMNFSPIFFAEACSTDEYQSAKVFLNLEITMFLHLLCGV